MIRNGLSTIISNEKGHVNRKLQNYNFINVEQLWLTVKEIWTNIDSDTFKKLVDRILEVQKSRGGKKILVFCS